MSSSASTSSSSSYTLRVFLERNQGIVNEQIDVNGPTLPPNIRTVQTADYIGFHERLKQIIVGKLQSDYAINVTINDISLCSMNYNAIEDDIEWISVVPIIKHNVNSIRCVIKNNDNENENENEYELIAFTSDNDAMETNDRDEEPSEDVILDEETDYEVEVIEEGVVEVHEEDIEFMDSIFPEVTYETFFDNMYTTEVISVGVKNNFSRIHMQERRGISLGYFFGNVAYEHESIPIDLTYYEYDLETAKTTKEKKTIIIMQKMVAFLYKKICSIPEYSIMRHQLFRSAKNVVNFIHGEMQSGKSAIISMIAIFFSVAFGCVIFVSVKNNDGKTSIEQFRQTLQPLDIITRILMNIKTEIDARHQNSSISNDDYRIMERAYAEINNLFRSVAIVSKSEIHKHTKKNTTKKKPTIVMLLTNSGFSKTIENKSAYFFDKTLSNFYLNNKEYMRFIWIADEADETIVTGTRIETPFEQAFFQKKIGTDECTKRTFFEHCSMVISVSATNVATMMSAKPGPIITQPFPVEGSITKPVHLRPSQYVEPLCINTILPVPMDYVGYTTGNIRQIIIRELPIDYYNESKLKYETFFMSLASTIPENIERINRKIEDETRHIKVPYKSVLINTAQTRYRNESQETTASEIRDSLNMVSSTFGTMKYVVFAYNGLTKKPKKKKESEELMVSTLHSNSIDILMEFSRINGNAINYINDEETTGSVSFSLESGRNDEFCSIRDIYDKIFMNIENTRRTREKWMVVAVSGIMTSRGTSLKTTDHRYPLTDLYYETSTPMSKNTKHYEASLEEIGRLCSKDRYMITRTLHLRKIAIKDDYDFIGAALSTYKFFYKVFKYQQTSETLRFTPRRLDELIQDYTRHLIEQDRLGSINPEDRDMLTWYFNNYIQSNNDITRTKITTPCKHRINNVCENEKVKVARIARRNEPEPEPEHVPARRVNQHRVLLQNNTQARVIYELMRIERENNSLNTNGEFITPHQLYTMLDKRMFGFSIENETYVIPMESTNRIFITEHSTNTSSYIDRIRRALTTLIENDLVSVINDNGRTIGYSLIN